MTVIKSDTFDLYKRLFLLEQKSSLCDVWIQRYKLTELKQNTCTPKYMVLSPLKLAEIS